MKSSKSRSESRLRAVIRFERYQDWRWLTREILIRRDTTLWDCQVKSSDTVPGWLTDICSLYCYSRMLRIQPPRKSILIFFSWLSLKSLSLHIMSYAGSMQKQESNNKVHSRKQFCGLNLYLKKIKQDLINVKLMQHTGGLNSSSITNPTPGFTTGKYASGEQRN